MTSSPAASWKVAVIPRACTRQWKQKSVLVREENQTLATITLQNYFRLYDKLSGMTGTAMTEDSEFREIYNLPVRSIPPNRQVQRIDEDDLIYRTVDAKFNAVADDIAERHAAGQPCLVGTVSIESSERLSRLLSKRGIKHEVLNAKNHEREAPIVAQAGRYGAVTIATNMAGRGTDILLGGNPDSWRRRGFLNDLGLDGGPTPSRSKQAEAEAEAIASRARAVLAAGGLTVIGTERHESRRIDNQLRGRSGRQGDPGATQFYLSLEDDLMRLFGGDKMDRVSKMMVTADMGDDMPIQHKIISKAVESAQHKVESINFSMRKSVLEYDDVMNKQRQVIYAERNKILDGKDLTDHITEVMHDTVYRCVQEFCTKDSHEGERDLEGLRKWVVELTGHIDTPQFPDEDFEALAADVLAYVEKCYNMKAERLGEDLMRELNTQVMLRVIDTRWMNYLQEIDYLKTGIGLRGFGQATRWSSTRPRPTARSRCSSIPCTRITCVLFCALRSRLPRRLWSTRRSPPLRVRASLVPPISMATTAIRCCASRLRCRPVPPSRVVRLPLTTAAR